MTKEIGIDMPDLDVTVADIEPVGTSNAAVLQDRKLGRLGAGNMQNLTMTANSDRLLGDH